MGAKLSFRYDRDADILHIDKRLPYPEQESEELGDEVIALHQTALQSRRIAVSQHLGQQHVREMLI